MDLDPVLSSGDRTVIKGRCLIGPIAVGAVFTQASTLVIHNLSGDQPKKIWSNKRQILLRVESIKAYSKDLDEIDEGLTALLELSGSGGGTLLPDDILQGRPP
jgi:hypothetical protein